MTTAVYMPVKTLSKFAEHAVAAGLAPDTPAIAIADATRPGEVTIKGTIATLPALIETRSVAGPTLVLWETASVKALPKIVQQQSR